MGASKHWNVGKSGFIGVTGYIVSGRHSVPVWSWCLNFQGPTRSLSTQELLRSCGNQPTLSWLIAWGLLAPTWKQCHLWPLEPAGAEVDWEPEFTEGLRSLRPWKLLELAGSLWGYKSCLWLIEPAGAWMWLGLKFSGSLLGAWNHRSHQSHESQPTLGWARSLGLLEPTWDHGNSQCWGRQRAWVLISPLGAWCHESCLSHGCQQVLG